MSDILTEWWISVVFLFGLSLLVWLAVLTLLLMRSVRHYRQLVKRPGETLEDVLTALVRAEGDRKKEIAQAKDDIAAIRDEMKGFVQHVGFVRFNPFVGETGGDQSFALSVLDGEKTGIIMSSLHSRTGTRFYAKPVVGGHGSLHPLSKEEERAVKESVKPPKGKS
ncbi:MAG: DUF4446 family protein [bacterium]|nr:DUF4446 family protein [bacterium]